MTINHLLNLKTKTKAFAKEGIGLGMSSDLVDWSADVQHLIDAEIERQSVTDEEIKEAIEMLEGIMPSEKEMMSGDYAEIGEAFYLAIQALEEYRPTESERVGNSDKLGRGKND